jgi:hypothetical protein
MNRYLQKAFAIFLFAIVANTVFAQNQTPELSTVNGADKVIEQIQNNISISADSA